MSYQMELRSLRYFVTVAEELHFARAAERLQLTQPALSKQIAALEKELDVQLFTRTKRTVSLTAAGQVLLEQTTRLLSQVDDIIQLTQRTARGEEGQLRIGFTATATHTILPALVRDFRDRFPRVELTMLELCTEAQVAALKEKRIDIAFLHPPIDERGLKLYPILEENFVAVLPKHHPLLRYEQIPLSALADEPLIVHPRNEGPVLYDGFIQVCQQTGFQPKIVQESISTQTRICLVAAGLGISFVPESVQFLVGTDVVCKSLADCPIKLKFAAAWRQDRPAPTLYAFLDSLLKGT
ncbi:MAG: LysR family transcriptional regulator [Leptolyngbyaceae bacterium]|nr:LysR family transcriptional regulator [Leptolyngbyaceae bacterium]